MSVRTPGRRRHRPAAELDPAFEVGHRAFLLGPLGRGEDDVRHLGRFRQEHVADHQQVERLQPRADLVHVGRRYRDVGGEHQQHPDAAFRRPAPGRPATRRPTGRARAASFPRRPRCRRCERDAPDCRACGIPEAGRPSGRAPARPARCPAPSGCRNRRTACPTLPSASARLMKASTLSTPLLCCSGPRAVRIMAVLAVPSMRAASSIALAGTPVIRSTRSGQ